MLHIFVDFLIFSTANNKQCLLDDMGYIVQGCNIAPKVSYYATVSWKLGHCSVHVLLEVWSIITHQQ